MSSTAVEILMKQRERDIWLGQFTERMIPTIWSPRVFRKFIRRSVGMPWAVRPPSPDMAQMLADIGTPEPLPDLQIVFYR